jgi:hypothetical protein
VAAPANTSPGIGLERRANVAAQIRNKVVTQLQVTMQYDDVSPFCDSNEQGLVAMKVKPPTKEYLERAKSLPRRDVELLMSRMGGKLTRRLEDKRLSAIEVLALQLELEDEQLKEWRKKVAEIRNKHKA